MNFICIYIITLLFNLNQSFYKAGNFLNNEFVHK